MEKILNNFVDNLKELFNDRLTSVFLYGSRATEDFAKTADLNVMVIIKDLSSADLKLAHNTIKPFEKIKNPLPIFMDRTEWFNSCDVFAIEYSDIKDRNKILHGEDLASGLFVDKKELRLQCEREVKNLLIRLRQSYLAKTSDKNALKNLIKLSSKSFMVIFRTILKLTNKTVPKSHEEVIKLFSEKSTGINFDPDMFLKILELRENPKAIKDCELELTVQKLIDTTNSVLKYVDKLEI